ncbi:hypothetical protein RQP46_000963 [Phenoliferia psychrophenolica]
MHYTTSLALAAALFSSALPGVDALPRPSGSAVLHGRRSLGQQQAYKTNEGHFHLPFLTAEIDYLNAKYKGGSKAAKHAATHNRRSFGTEALINYQTDSEYYGFISMGTPSQSLAVDFDTGSAGVLTSRRFETLSTDATFTQRRNSETFNESQSSTFLTAGNPFSIQYGSGAVSGKVATDTVSVAGLTVAKQGFGDVTTCSSQFQGSSAGGILGLAFSSIARSGTTTFVQNLVAQNSLDKNVFGFFLSRAGASGSTLTIGSLDSTHYSGTIQYTPVTQQTYWKVSAGSTVGGQAVGGGYSAAIDTGTTLIYLPSSVASAVYAAIPGAAKSTYYSSTGSDVYTFPCNFQGPVAFTFGGISSTFAIDSRDFNLGYAGSYQTCVGGIIGSTFNDGQPLAIVEFLKSWYSVYSFANGGSVGYNF